MADIYQLSPLRLYHGYLEHDGTRFEIVNPEDGCVVSTGSTARELRHLMTKVLKPGDYWLHIPSRYQYQYFKLPHGRGRHREPAHRDALLEMCEIDDPITFLQALIYRSKESDASDNAIEGALEEARNAALEWLGTFAVFGKDEDEA